MAEGGTQIHPVFSFLISFIILFLGGMLGLFGFDLGRKGSIGASLIALSCAAGFIILCIYVLWWHLTDLDPI